MKNTRLEEIRDDRELTKKEFAKQLGVSDSIYSRWENEKDPIPTKRMYQIANLYSLNLDYILKLTDKKYTLVSDDIIDLNIVATRIRQIREEFNETLRMFARRFNTTSSTWSAYETGKVLILGSFLIEVCKIGNYSADWILGRTDNKYINLKY